jgi:hypothetical protein
MVGIFPGELIIDPVSHLEVRPASKLADPNKIRLRKIETKHPCSLGGVDPPPSTTISAVY